MKQFILSVIVVLAMVCTANAYTYDGKVDPRDVATNCTPVGQQGKLLLGACENESGKHAVWFLPMENGQLVIIRYTVTIDDVIHVYELTKEGHYKQIHPEPAVRI